MKLLSLSFVALAFILLGVILLLGIMRTWRVQSNQIQQEFLKGNVPTNLNGLYKGTVNIKTTWQGKKFNSSKSTGINIFKDANDVRERYPFKTYVGKALQDDIQVLKIDYNLPENPLWLRFVVDELVQTKPGKYLGKLNVKFPPGISFGLGYFTLEK